MTDPGWYPDPDGGAHARYWDGSVWTDRYQAPSDDAEVATPRSRWRLGIGAVLVLALLAGGFFVFAGGDEASAAEVVLESATEPGQDPFLESIASRPVEVEAGGVEVVSGGDAAVEALSGDTPGLYGGTGEDACDPEALVGFLTANADKAAAFAGVLGIGVGSIADHVATLTPVVLREDTRVTNHGFSDGEATPRQSVLQAGTAVLVDDRGVPRVRCSCGNPLGEPVAADAAAGFVGEAWAGFDENRLVAVAPAAETLTGLELVDLATGQPYRVPVGEGHDELTLGSDGLGVVIFGQRGADVQRILGEELGAPTATIECRADDPAGCGTTHDPLGTYLIWDGLTVYIAADSGAFEHYSRGGRADSAGTYVPDPNPAVSTPEGISVGSTSAELLAAHPGLLAFECGAGGSAPADPETDGILVSAEPDGYTFLVQAGQVVLISNQTERVVERFRGCRT